MNNLEEEIWKRYGSFELSHSKNQEIVNNISEFTADISVKFAMWIADVKLHGYSKQLHEAMIIHGKKTTEELFHFYIENFYKK